MQARAKRFGGKFSKVSTHCFWLDSVLCVLCNCASSLDRTALHRPVVFLTLNGCSCGCLACRNRVDDARYKDRTWIRKERRWPPKLAQALEALLDIKSV